MAVVPSFFSSKTLNIRDYSFSKDKTKALASYHERLIPSEGTESVEKFVFPITIIIWKNLSLGTGLLL